LLYQYNLYFIILYILLFFLKVISSSYIVYSIDIDSKGKSRKLIDVGNVGKKQTKTWKLLSISNGYKKSYILTTLPTLNILKVK